MGINLCPRWMWEKLGLREDMGEPVALCLSALLALVSSPLLMRLPHVCLMKAAFGIPCPGCGILHSLSALLRLDFHNAVRFNPAGIAVALAFTSQIAASLATLAWAGVRNRAFALSHLASGIGWMALMLVWIMRLFHL